MREYMGVSGSLLGKGSCKHRLSEIEIRVYNTPGILFAI